MAITDPRNSPRAKAAGADLLPPIRFLPAALSQQALPEGRLAIADMASAFGVTHRTLHFYEEKGMLAAARRGPMRVYGPREIQRMALINTCRETGMPLTAIQNLLQNLSGAEDQQEADAIFRAAILARRGELVAEQASLRNQMQQIDQLLDGTGEADIETSISAVDAGLMGTEPPALF